MRRLLVTLALAGCTGGGEGGGNVEATVFLRSISCELPDSMTVVARATFDVFMRDTLVLRVFTSSNAFPQDGPLMTTSLFQCGDWSASSDSCVPGPGDPPRTTIEFTSTTELDFELPPEVSVSVNAFVTNELGELAAEDFEEASCP